MVSSLVGRAQNLASFLRISLICPWQLLCLFPQLAGLKWVNVQITTMAIKRIFSLLQLTVLKNFVIPHFAHNSTLFGREWRGCQFTKIISFFRSQHFWSPLYQFLNIFLPLEILLKNVFCSYSWAVFWSLSCHRELKLTTKPFTGRTLRARCKILAFEVWACTESKILR